MYKCYFCKRELKDNVYFIGDATVVTDDGKGGWIDFNTSHTDDKCFCKLCFNLAEELISTQEENKNKTDQEEVTIFVDNSYNPFEH